MSIPIANSGNNINHTGNNISHYIHTGLSGITSATNYTKSDNNICQSWTLNSRLWEITSSHRKVGNNNCQNVSNNINSHMNGNNNLPKCGFYFCHLTITSVNKTNNHTIMAPYCHCWNQFSYFYPNYWDIYLPTHQMFGKYYRFTFSSDLEEAKMDSGKSLSQS